MACETSESEAPPSDNLNDGENGNITDAIDEDTLTLIMAVITT